MGAGSGCGVLLESRAPSGTQPCRAAPLHTAWSSWGAGMSHLVGSHLQSLLLKQFHSLGGWKTGHQLGVSEEGALPPHPPQGQGSWVPQRRRQRGSKVTTRPGLAQPCSASSAWAAQAASVRGRARAGACLLTSMAA